MDEPDFNPEDEQDIQVRLEGEFTRPCEPFRNQSLWPFTNGSKALYQMTCDDADTRLYRALAFVYIHIRRGAATMEEDIAKHIAPLVWHNLNLFRVNVLSMLDTMTASEIEDAIRITAKEFQIESISEFVASPPEITGAPQKKSKAATSRQKRRGKSTTRRKR